METCSLPSCYYYGYQFARETPKKHSKRKASSSTHTTGKKRKISRFHCNVCITNYEERNEFTSNPLEETDEVIEQTEEEEMHSDVVDTISSLTVAMEHAVDNFDFFMKEIKQFKEQYIITVTVSQLLGCHWVLVHNGEADPVPYMG